jgi:hypothetical protein
MAGWRSVNQQAAIVAFGIAFVPSFSSYKK